MGTYSSEDEVERGGEYDSELDLGRRDDVDGGSPRDEIGAEVGSNETEYVCMILCEVVQICLVMPGRRCGYKRFESA